jgi:hypothetical protein
MLKADVVLAQLAAHPHAMGTLEGGPCTIQHVSRRVADGPDERLDKCPCDRKLTEDDLATLSDSERRNLDLGNGQYISSPTHTLADLVRDVLK